MFQQNNVRDIHGILFHFPPIGMRTAVGKNSSHTGTETVLPHSLLPTQSKAQPSLFRPLLLHSVLPQFRRLMVNLCAWLALFSRRGSPTPAIYNLELNMKLVGKIPRYYIYPATTH